MGRRKKRTDLLSLLEAYQLNCGKDCFHCKWKVLRSMVTGGFSCPVDLTVDLINTKENFPDLWDQYHG